jgi:hypothetical protein
MDTHGSQARLGLRLFTTQMTGVCIGQGAVGAGAYIIPWLQRLAERISF